MINRKNVSARLEWNRLAWTLVACAVLAGCGDSPAIESDAGHDAATRDAATSDAATTDSGHDASMIDAHVDPSDAAMPDAGRDAAVLVDAGMDAPIAVDAGSDAGPVIPTVPTLAAVPAGPTPTSDCAAAPDVATDASIEVARGDGALCGAATGNTFTRLTLAPGESMTYDTFSGAELGVLDACGGACVISPPYFRGGVTNSGTTPMPLVLESTAATDLPASLMPEVVVHRGTSTGTGACATAPVVANGDVRYAQHVAGAGALACGLHAAAHYAVDVPAGHTLVAWVNNESDGSTMQVAVREDCTATCVATGTSGGDWQRVTYAASTARRVYLVIGGTSAAYFRLAVAID